MLVAFDEIAIIDHDGVEIAPLWHVLRQAVLFPYLGLPLLDPLLNRLDEI